MATPLRSSALLEEELMDDKLIIAGIEFKSRLWVGTGKYKDFEETKKAIEASGADVVDGCCKTCEYY